MTVLWFNGRVCQQQDVRIPVTDRGLTLGDGLFETLRVHKGMPLRVAFHAERLQEGGRILGLPVPHCAQIERAAVELLAATGLQTGSLRLTVTRGSGPRGLLPPADVQPTLFMTASSGVPTCKAVSVVTSQLVRQDERSLLCQIKTLNYLPYILARQEAASKGVEEALLLNTQGRVAESTISTVVVQRNGGLFTPALTEGALPGVARRVLLEAGLLHEAVLEQASLYEAEAVYLVNSLGVRSVATLDGVALRQSHSGLTHVCGALDMADFC